MKTTVIVLTIAITSCITVCGMLGCFVGGIYFAIAVDDAVTSNNRKSKVSYDK